VEVYEPSAKALRKSVLDPEDRMVFVPGTKSAVLWHVFTREIIQVDFRKTKDSHVERSSDTPVGLWISRDLLATYTDPEKALRVLTDLRLPYTVR